MTTRRQLASASLALAPFSVAAQVPRGTVALTAGEFFQEFIQVFDTTINFTHASEVSVSRFAQTALGTLSQILDRQNDIRTALNNVRYTVREEIFYALYNEDVRNFMGA